MSKLYGPEVKEAQDRLLELIADNCNVKRSLRLAGIASSTHYKWIATQPEYAERVKQAMKEGSDELVNAAVTRGVEGVDEPVYYQGILCGTIRKYSDSLLALLLKAHRPEFKDQSKSEITFTDTASGLDLKNLSDDELEQFKRLLGKAGSGSGDATAGAEQNSEVLPE